MPLFMILAAAAAGLFLYQKSRGSTVGAGGPPGTIVDVNPIMGHRQVNVSLGQTVRINLPSEWILLQDASLDPASAPLQPVPSRGIGGLTFTAAMPGKQSLTFTTRGRDPGKPITIEVDVSPMQIATGHYGYGTGWGYHGGYHYPYREFWGRFRTSDPYWRWRETQWRVHRHWEPAWGPQPPPPSDPAVDVIEQA